MPNALRQSFALCTIKGLVKLPLNDNYKSVVIEFTLSELITITALDFPVGIFGSWPQSAFNDRPSRLGRVGRAQRVEVGRQPVLHRPVPVLRRHPSSLRASSRTGWTSETGLSCP